MQRFCAFLSALLLAGALSFLPVSANSYPAAESVAWFDSLDDAFRMARQNHRPLLIDVYAPWCGWCKIMHSRTYSSPVIAAYINQKFYAVRLNAETKDTLTFQGQRYTYKAEHRANELAYALLTGRMSYPTTVFMNEKAEVLSPVKGYLDVPTFSKVLHYFGEGEHLRTSWQAFEKSYKPAQ